jgi:hypothetical protein
MTLVLHAASLCKQGRRSVFREDHPNHELGTFKTQKEAIDWVKAKGHAPPCDWLESEGFEVAYAENLERSYAQLEAHVPHAVFARYATWPRGWSIVGQVDQAAARAAMPVSRSLRISNR